MVFLKECYPCITALNSFAATKGLREKSPHLDQNKGFLIPLLPELDTGHPAI